jgi:hypothetical protein
MKSSIRQGGGKDTITSGLGAENRFSGGVSGAGGTYSTIANMPKARKQRYISEANSMLGGAKKCKDLWVAMRKADFRKEGVLNEANIDLVVEKNKEPL